MMAYSRNSPGNCGEPMNEDAAQLLCCPRRHHSQWPQLMVGSMETRSPGFNSRDAAADCDALRPPAHDPAPADTRPASRKCCRRDTSACRCRRFRPSGASPESRPGPGSAGERRFADFDGAWSYELSGFQSTTLAEMTRMSAPSAPSTALVLPTTTFLPSGTSTSVLMPTSR